MKQKPFLIIVFIFCIGIGCSSTFKKKGLTTFVYDNEKDLTEEQKQQFDVLFGEHQKRTSNEIVLVTTPGYSGNDNLVLYATEFINKNGIGKKETNNGVVIAFSKANKSTAIATGYGTEKVLKDELAKKIIDSLMIPQFKGGNYFDGLLAGSKAVVDFLDKPQNKIVNTAK